MDQKFHLTERKGFFQSSYTDLAMSTAADTILILDFGSQYTQLIARRVRECGVYSEIHHYGMDVEHIKLLNPKGIILSGGPSSVLDSNTPRCDKEIFKLRIPILGICYGMQLMVQALGGEVERGEKREYGRAFLVILEDAPLWRGFVKKGRRKCVWMSHGDRVVKLPRGFVILAKSHNSPIAAMGDLQKGFYGVQFHPEVIHTPRGKQLIRNFLFNICPCHASWSMTSFIAETIAKLKQTIGSHRVVCALSGGVDSSVTALLVHKAVGDQLHAIFVDNGLLRKDESKEVVDIFRGMFTVPLHHIVSQRLFLDGLRGVVDPEEKRRIIGNLFIEVFEKEARKIGNVKFLAQGTLYPDVIESVSSRGPSATIKSHHNVGGLPQRMNLRLIEPLRELFKDEVRKLGSELGLPDTLLKRQPFPGPGLAIRILGEVTEERLRMLREADHIVSQEIEVAGLQEKLWQSFAVLLPVRTVGVMGDGRTYENVIALRIVNSIDGMTADWARIPYDLLACISSRMINEVEGINRVVYDISSKPPSTIEWE